MMIIIIIVIMTMMIMMVVLVMIIVDLANDLINHYFTPRIPKCYVLNLAMEQGLKCKHK